jgi:hypothetical protein
MLEGIKTLYKHHIYRRTRPSHEEISKVLHSVVRKYSRSFIVLDALDECQVSDGGRKRFLSEIFNLQKHSQINLFATSRFIPEIQNEFKSSITLEIRASADDIQRYLTGKMSQLRPFVLRNPDLQQKIKTEITRAVDGM